jgi:hypothetical protein
MMPGISGLPKVWITGIIICDGTLPTSLMFLLGSTEKSTAL